MQKAQMILTIDYQLTGSGWADCTIRSGERECKVSASYLSDALRKLVLAAAAVLAGAHHISVGFDEEPGEYRWSVVSTDAGIIQVTISSFQHLWGNLPDADGTPMLSVSCTPLNFGNAVREAAEAALKKHGLVDYNAQWGHDFPSKELELLQSYIAVWGRARR
jgi:hypothetical protein